MEYCSSSCDISKSDHIDDEDWERIYQNGEFDIQVDMKTNILNETFPIILDKLGGFDFYRKALNSPKRVLAPMVNQSELPFRMLCRKYNTDLCYTPMFHSKLFATETNYRKRYWSTCPEDRPLVVQFCANDPQYLLKAAKIVENDCDAVDINFGCPQRIAKTGNYGAFLMEKPELQCQLVKMLHDHLKIPVFCKIRIFPSYEQTLKYAKMIEAAGCQLLTVHGRTREMKGPHMGLADWEVIRKLKSELSIPVFSNGNIQEYDDVARCLEFTKTEGVMSAEGLLHNPSLFTEPSMQPSSYQIANDYLDLCEAYPTRMVWIRNHLFKIFVDYVTDHHEIRDHIFSCQDIPSARDFVVLLQQFSKDSDLSRFKIGTNHHDKKTRIKVEEKDFGDLFGGIDGFIKDF